MVGSDNRTMANAKVRNLAAAAPDVAAEAREQADEYDSIFGNTPLELGNGKGTLMVPPHPDYMMLDDEKMDEYDQLMFDVDTKYDRHPDIHIPEQTLDGGLKLAAETQRGAVMRPFRINNELVKPAHSVRVVQVALGAADYALLKEGGLNASDVWKIWGRQSQLIKERQQRDSKSAGSGVDLAAVPPADS